MQRGIKLQILLGDDGKCWSEVNSYRASDLSGYQDYAVCPQCIIIKCSDLHGQVQRCNWNCAEHKLDLKNFFCISALRNGEVVSLASRDKEKSYSSCSVASCFFKLNSTAIRCFEMTGVVRRSHLFCTSTGQVGMKEMTKHMKTPLAQKVLKLHMVGSWEAFLRKYHKYTVLCTYLVIIIPRHLLLGTTKPGYGMRCTFDLTYHGLHHSKAEGSSWDSVNKPEGCQNWESSFRQMPRQTFFSLAELQVRGHIVAWGGRVACNKEPAEIFH